MAGAVRGKVARILNSRELVINRGSDDGVRLGMKFAVLDPAAQGIRDPDTGEELGSIMRTKAQLEVSQVSEHICVARTYRHVTVNTGGQGASMGQIARMFSPPNYERRYETLRADEADWQPLTEEESIVKVGDPVVEIAPHEEISGDIGGFISDEPKEIG